MSDKAVSATDSAKKKASEVQRKEGRGASVHAARVSTVKNVASNYSVGIPSSVTKAASEGQGKYGRGGNERKQGDVWRAQDRSTKTSPLPSGGVAALSPNRQAQGGATGTSPISSLGVAAPIPSRHDQSRATRTSPPSGVGGSASSQSRQVQSGEISVFST